MNEWNIDYDRDIVEQALIALEKGEYKKAFDDAEFYLRRLVEVLRELSDEADYQVYRLEQEAVHYGYLQDNYNDNPQGYSDSEAEDIFKKKPSDLYACAKNLKDEKQKLKNLIQYLNNIIYCDLKRMREYVDDDVKNLIEKISRAIEIMAKYQSVRF